MYSTTEFSICFAEGIFISGILSINDHISQLIVVPVFVLPVFVVPVFTLRIFFIASISSWHRAASTSLFHSTQILPTGVSTNRADRNTAFMSAVPVVSDTLHGAYPPSRSPVSQNNLPSFVVKNDVAAKPVYVIHRIMRVITIRRYILCFKKLPTKYIAINCNCKENGY